MILWACSRVSPLHRVLAGSCRGRKTLLNPIHWLVRDQCYSC